MNGMKPLIKVTAAIICHEDRILCARKAPGRSLAGLWEFPGGKIETGETPEACLARELSEELLMDARIGSLFAVNQHEYEDKIVELAAYWVVDFDGTPALTDHDQIQWLTAAELTDLTWAPADIPFVDKLQQFKSPS